MTTETISVINIPHYTFVAKRVEWPANTIHDQQPLMFQGRERWNVCRVMEDPLEPLHHAIVPVQFGLNIDEALTEVAKRNDAHTLGQYYRVRDELTAEHAGCDCFLCVEVAERIAELETAIQER